MTQCQYCQQYITFDDWHVSQKSGKKIPLDSETFEPHRCQESLDAWRKEHPLICKSCHTTRLYFHNEVFSKNGRPIPLEVSTGEPHDCPKSSYKNRDKKRV